MENYGKSFLDKILMEEEQNEFGTDFAEPQDRMSAAAAAFQGGSQEVIPNVPYAPDPLLGQVQQEEINDIVEADNAPISNENVEQEIQQIASASEREPASEELPVAMQNSNLMQGMNLGTDLNVSDIGNKKEPELSSEEQLLKEFREFKEKQKQEMEMARQADSDIRFGNTFNKGIQQIGEALASGYANVKMKPFEIKSNLTDQARKDSQSRMENLLQEYKLMGKEGKDKQNWKLTTLEDPETGEPKVFRINPVTGEKEEIGTRGYSNRLVKDPITGNYIDPRAILRGEESEKKQSEIGKGTFGKLTPNQRKELKDLKSSFEKETLKVRDSYDKIKGLSDKQLELAINNPIAASQLGAQVATIFENGRLTDEDVVRYTRRQGIPDRIADTIINLKNGTISESKASEIKESLKVFEQVLQDQINRRALGKAKSMEENYGIPSKDLVKNVYPDYKAPKILVKLPNGKRGRIDSDKIEDFLSKYPDAEIME